MPTALEKKWTGARIRSLRQKMSLTQAEFGRHLYDQEDEAQLQSIVSRLERGKVKPGAAARMMLEVLEQRASRT